MKGDKILLLGLGKANFPVARYLTERGAEIYLHEEKLDKLPRDAARFINDTGVKPYENRKYDMVISSPGFPVNRPVVQEIIDQGNVIIDEIEFTFDQLERPSVIAVTGTNGKSTTVALISAILSANKVEHFTGGNIAPGKPFSEALFLPRFEHYVLEISSFQLMRIIKFRPYVGVITNITLDHMNWHRDFEEYRNAKLRLFENQNENDYAVVNADDPGLVKFSQNLRARTVFFGFDAHNGAWLNGDFWFGDKKLFAGDELKIAGRHNQLNVMASIAVAELLDLADQKLADAIGNFKTLPHRLEEIAVKNGVHFINNSMCTNENAAIESFKAYKEPRIVIVGGKEKGDRGINYLSLLIREAKYCVILGDNASFIERFFNEHDYGNYQTAHSMNEAVNLAEKIAAPGDIVILNPGYASFDYFVNFEDRGEAFRRAVNES